MWFHHEDGEMDGPFRAEGDVKPDGFATVRINGQWFYDVDMLDGRRTRPGELVRWSFPGEDRYNRAEVV